MANEIQIFYSGRFGTIRALSVDGEPWFVAKDILDMLDLDRTALRKLDEDEKGVDTIHTPGGDQQVTTVSESGFYKLVLKSRKPEAKAFQHWVTHEVLPDIRKHGAYMTPVTIDKIIADPAFGIRLLTELQGERERRAELQAENEEMRPKARFAEAVEASHTSILVGDYAKILRQNGVDIGQNRLFAWLRDNGYLMKHGNSKNMPTQRSMDLKLFEVKERTFSNPDGSVRITRTTKMTGKGQVYFLDKFVGAQSD